PGSGKTASVLGAYIYLRDYLDSVDRLFVIGPISSFKAWREEYKILYPGYSKYEIFDSGEEKDTLTRVEILKSDFNKFNLILINYEAVPLVDNILSQLISHRTMIVFDEIHRIKRIEGKQFNATYKIAENASYRTALTGTPLPNGYKDLHNLFKILYDEYSYSYFGFSSDYLNDIQKRFDNMQIEDKELNSKINPFFVRLSKNDLGVPPANPDNLYWIEPSREEKITYQNIFYDDNKTMFSKTISLIQVGLLSNYAKNVKQIDHEQFTNDDSNLQKEPDTIPDDLSTSKADAIVKLVNDLISQGKSVVIWAVFIKSILVLDKALKKQGIDVRLIYGNIGIQSRDKIINDFNNGKFQVLLTNPSTLAESVSLHKVCHDAIYVEMNFNLAQYLQSRDRIHRLGLSEDVETNYHIFINKYEQPSIDEKIYDRLKEKEKQMYTAINEGKLFTQENVNISDFNSMFDKGR
ncbi:MAG: DEAD/DEAH box helicase, partial [archaeon]